MLHKSIDEKTFREELEKYNFSDDFLKLCLDENNIEVRFTRTGSLPEQCDRCSELITAHSLIGQVAFTICHPSCIPSLACSGCNSKFKPQDSGYTWHAGGIICNDCHKKMVPCKHCNSVWAPAKLFNGFCPSCVIPCGRCGNNFGIPEMYLLRGSRVCKLCGGRDIWVKGHDFNPLTILQFHGNPRNGIFFGVELEIECASLKDCILMAEDVTKTFGKSIVVKHDGSLKEKGQSGLELVTAPGDFDFHKKLWKEFFEKEYKFDSFHSERCSTHVHISKQPLRPMQLARMAHFMYAAGNRELIQKIAGRNLNTPWGQRYAAINQKMKISDVVEVYGGRSYVSRQYGIVDETLLIPPSQRTVNYKKSVEALGARRYSALNLTNPNTAEVRIFSGTSTYAGMMKNIEFCQAMIDFCGSGKSVQSSIRDLSSADAFINYVVSNRYLYPHLYKFMLADIMPWMKKKNKEAVCA